MYKQRLFGAVVIGAAIASAGVLVADPAARPPVTLLGTLAEWRYPDSEFHGAQMSDGGNRQIQSINCQTVLTTADSVEDVVEFYSKKLGVSESGTGRGQQADADAKSVATQDDSDGRPVQVRVIVVNKDESSTTIVVSRADGEDETHIAVTHYLRL
jgi:hypothetical protein